MITAPNEYKEPVQPQSSLSDSYQNTTPFYAFKNSLHGSNASLNDGMEVEEASFSAALTVKHDSKTATKQKFCT